MIISCCASVAISGPGAAKRLERITMVQQAGFLPTAVGDSLVVVEPEGP